jgi:ketosteroid isomerase-like protein
VALEPAPAEVLALATDWLNAALRRDAAFVLAHTHEAGEGAVVTIASAPDSNLTLSELVAHLSEFPPRFSVTSQPHGFVDGDLACTVDLPRIDMLDDGVVQACHTLVMHRDGDGWKVVHSQVSEGVHREL